MKPKFAEQFKLTPNWSGLLLLECGWWWFIYFIGWLSKPKKRQVAQDIHLPHFMFGEFIADFVNVG